MIAEEKQYKSYVVALTGVTIFVAGVAIGAWSDKYFWYAIASVFLVPIGYYLQVITLDWRHKFFYPKYLKINKARRQVVKYCRDWRNK